MKSKTRVLAGIVIIALGCSTGSAKGEETPLPESIVVQLDTPLEKIGQAVYRKFGFRVYEASLWATQNTWETNKPYALQLWYARDLSKETLVDTVMDDIAEQNVVDEATQSQWKAVLESVLTDIKEGDILTGLAVPGEKTALYYNGAHIVSIEDKTFSDAFFNIWLGNNADDELREKLLKTANADENESTLAR